MPREYATEVLANLQTIINLAIEYGLNEFAKMRGIHFWWHVS